MSLQVTFQLQVISLNFKFVIICPAIYYLINFFVVPCPIAFETTKALHLHDNNPKTALERTSLISNESVEQFETREYEVPNSPEEVIITGR